MTCYYRPQDSENPDKHGLNDKIIKLVDQHKGHLVPIPGFDSLLIQIGDQFGYGRFDGEVTAVAKNRADKYLNQIEKLTANETTTADTKSALSSIAAKGDRDWWYYEQLVVAETDIDKQEQIYLKGIAELGDEQGYKLHYNYAKHLIAQHKLSEAKNYISKAFELNNGQKQALDLELHFYRYACFFDEYPEAKTNIKTLLEQGVSSPGWYLDNVIEVAKSLNHPEIDDVVKFAAQINEES
ncbi:MAG: hypothetical protein MJK04_29930 [Psychrosphaera sp.]|nr:hypothetical protein [Psychrosphaera sp.]